MPVAPASRPLIALSLAALLALAACSKADNDPGPGGVTVGEARALDEAAEMLEDQRLPAEAVPAPRGGAPASPARPSAAQPANQPAA